MMFIDWKELTISSAELEQLVPLDLLSNWAIDLDQVLYLNQRKSLKSLIVTEACTLFIVTILVFPVILITFRFLGWLNTNGYGFILVLFSTVFLSMLIVLLFNYYLWQQAKRLKFLAILLNKVEQYNNFIDNLRLVNELNLVEIKINQKQQPSNISQVESELMAALSLTRNSLLRSLELEKILDRDRNLVNNRYQLLANLESGLINLDFLASHDSNDYQQLLSEAIEIGLSVHQEIRKTNTLKH